MYFVYLLECVSASGQRAIYTGITTDVRRRFDEHRAGKGGHYTSSRVVQRMLYKEKYTDRSSASRRESEIKSLSRVQKLKLIKKSRLCRRQKSRKSLNDILRPTYVD